MTNWTSATCSKSKSLTCFWLTTRSSRYWVRSITRRFSCARRRRWRRLMISKDLSHQMHLLAICLDSSISTLSMIWRIMIGRILMCRSGSRHRLSNKCKKSKSWKSPEWMRKKNNQTQVRRRKRRRKSKRKRRRMWWNSSKMNSWLEENFDISYLI